MAVDLSAVTRTQSMPQGKGHQSLATGVLSNCRDWIKHGSAEVFPSHSAAPATQVKSRSVPLLLE